MDRKQFLNIIGMGAAFALTSTCLGGCKKDDDNNKGAPADFTLDLAAAANANLAVTGGYVIKNGIIVVNLGSGNYVAATQTCAHEGKTQVYYNGTNWRCAAHGATFNLTTGASTSSVTGSSLTIYKTSLTGTNLRVYS